MSEAAATCDGPPPLDDGAGASQSSPSAAPESTPDSSVFRRLCSSFAVLRAAASASSASLRLPDGANAAARCALASAVVAATSAFSASLPSSLTAAFLRNATRASCSPHAVSIHSARGHGLPVFGSSGSLPVMVGHAVRHATERSSRYLRRSFSVLTVGL